MAAKKKPAEATVARYADPHRRPHRVILRGRLLIDLAAGHAPRLVASLSEDEGEAEARALLDGSAIDEGYLARARREPRPFIRPLTAEDVRPAAPEAGPDDAADGSPLAA